MKKAGQYPPPVPTIPDVETRRLRAKLILEEAFETIEALGFRMEGTWENYKIVEQSPPNLELIADGCADLSVVNIGTLIACGIDDVELLREVDEANLRKF